MNAHKIHELALSRDEIEQRKALTETLAYLHTLTTAVLEIAGEVKLRTERDVLSLRSRSILREFVSLGNE